MDKLGFMITPKGDCYTFGEFREFGHREIGNPHLTHDNSFAEEVLLTGVLDEYNLNLEKGLLANLKPLAQQNFIVGLNRLTGDFVPDTKTLLMTSPDLINKEQKEALTSIEDELLSFPISSVYLITEKGETVDMVDINDYYKTIKIKENTRRR